MWQTEIDERLHAAIGTQEVDRKSDVLIRRIKSATVRQIIFGMLGRHDELSV